MTKVITDIDYDDQQPYALPSYVDSDRRIDVERFIFNMSMNESIVVLLLAMSLKPKEIAVVLQRKNVNYVYNIIAKLRRGSIWDEEF